MWNNVGYPKLDFDLKPIEPRETSINRNQLWKESVLKKIQLFNVNMVVIRHTNINSIRNKFDMLSSMVKDNIDILMVSETNLDSSFP